MQQYLPLVARCHQKAMEAAMNKANADAAAAAKRKAAAAAAADLKRQAEAARAAAKAKAPKTQEHFVAIFIIGC